MTAGMGCVASTDSEYESLLKLLEKKVVKPTINMIIKEILRFKTATILDLIPRCHCIYDQ